MSFYTILLFDKYDTGYFFLCFWPPPVACGILVPRPGIEPQALGSEVQSPNHRTARELAIVDIFLTWDKKPGFQRRF